MRKKELLTDIRKMDIELLDVHLTKAQVFYGRKKEAKILSRASSHKEAICMDFAKKFCGPIKPCNKTKFSR